MVSDRTKHFRGSRTHGRGKKAGRGAGLRGGRGNAGMHKHKWIYTVKYEPDHFGRYGFKRPQGMVKEVKTINVCELSTQFAGQKEVNLTEAGYGKLLGNGSISVAMTVTVAEASEKAKEKLEAAGGKLVLSE
jgi:large subunit ribosomal protein L15